MSRLQRGQLGSAAISAPPANLQASLWQARGPDNGLITLSNTSEGFLQIVVSADVDLSFVSFIGGSMTDGTVRAIMHMSNMSTTVDHLGAGPGIRMSGTDGSSNANGYHVNIRRYGNLSDQYVWRLGKIAAGAVTVLGTDSASLGGALTTEYSDIRLTVLTNGANADVSMDCRREGQGAAEDTDSVIADTSPSAGTEFGIWIRNTIDATPVITVKHFEVTPA